MVREDRSYIVGQVPMYLLLGECSTCTLIKTIICLQVEKLQPLWVHKHGLGQ